MIEFSGAPAVRNPKCGAERRQAAIGGDGTNVVAIEPDVGRRSCFQTGDCIAGESIAVLVIAGPVEAEEK